MKIKESPGIYIKEVDIVVVEFPVYMVLFDESARKEINKIWEANIQLF